MASDADVMQGGPGGPAPKHGDPAPADGPSARREPAATRKVVLDGVEYTVDAGLAGALQKEKDRVAGAFGARLQHYERRLAALEVEDDEPEEAPAPTALQPPDPKWLDATSDSYDPQRYHQANLEYQHALVEQGLAAVEDRRHQEQQAAAASAQQQANWNRNVTKFYADNPTLRGKEDVVDAVWRANFAALSPLNLTDGFNKLAELTKARLVELSESGKRESAPRAPRLETSASARANREPEPSEEQAEAPVQGGLSAAIKAKHRRFLNPNFGSGKAA